MSAINTLIRAVQAAMHEYDKSGDHVHVGPRPGDCLRCALKPFERLATCRCKGCGETGMELTASSYCYPLSVNWDNGAGGCNSDPTNRSKHT